MKSQIKYLILVAGPTAVGKTSLAIELARFLNTEILSIDSRQVYKELEIGTAKPTTTELSKVKHHFINSHSITDNLSAAVFEKEALALLDKLFEHFNVVVGVGGSGLYIDALCNGFDNIPEIDPSFRENLNQTLIKEGIESIQTKLKEVDPDYYQIVDTNNPQRMIRAIEVMLATGKAFSSYLKREKVNRPFDIIKIGLERDRKELYERIDSRMETMIVEGLFEEAEKFYPKRHLNALQTVGYKEIFEYLDGKVNKEEAIRLLKRNSRRYAKRQLTWFRKDSSIKWFQADKTEEIKEYVSSIVYF